MFGVAVHFLSERHTISAVVAVARFHVGLSASFVPRTESLESSSKGSTNNETKNFKRSNPGPTRQITRNTASQGPNYTDFSSLYHQQHANWTEMYHNGDMTEFTSHCNTFGLPHLYAANHYSLGTYGIGADFYSDITPAYDMYPTDGSDSGINNFHHDHTYADHSSSLSANPNMKSFVSSVLFVGPFSAD